MPRKTTYHHGDLRNALLHAALIMVEETGLEQLSMRRIAASVGVSHAAPEHHFPSMRHLYNAMAIWGFETFVRTIGEQLARAPDEGAEMLRAARRGYIQFASEHPHVLRLMFNSGLLDWTAEALCGAADAAWRQLLDLSAPAAAHLGLKTEQEQRALAGLVWSQIHGEAHLLIDKKLPDVSGGGRPLDMASLIFGQFGHAGS
ncbi:MAG: TetR/AcrR family transcriptional regulator [Rhizobium sp.]|nr:TetR/AcrR family transcriptional regulator [Rhizobium sp.]